MSDMEWFVTWLGGSIVLFVVWVLIPEKAHEEFEKGARIPNPILRQGALFLTLVTYLAVEFAVVAAALVAVFAAEKYDLLRNTTTVPKEAWWVVGAVAVLILIFSGKRKKRQERGATYPELGENLWRCRRCESVNTNDCHACARCGARRFLSTM